jgi:hypothetical protein
MRNDPVLFIGFLLFVSIVCGWMASSKGRNVFVWAALGALFPLFAWVVILVLRDKKYAA